MRFAVTPTLLSRQRNVLVIAISLVLAASIAATIGVNLFFSLNANSLVLVEPIVFPPVSPVMGEKVKTQFRLRNESDQAVTVCHTRTSCGCTHVYPIESPQQVKNIVIQPRATSDWTVVIDTSARLGTHQFLVWFDYLKSGTPHSLGGAVRLSIQPGFSARPPSVDVNPIQSASRGNVNAQLLIYDSGSEDDLKVSKITVSDPNVVKWSISEASDEVKVERGHSIRLRYRVTVKILSEPNSGGSVSHWIRFLPNRDATLLHVPIEIHDAPPPFRAIPSTLTIGEPADSDVIVRRVSIVSHQQPLERLTVHGDDDVQWTSIPSNDGRTKQFEIRVYRPWKTTYELQIRENDKAILTIPLRILSLRNDG
jgi:hypothetical protein